MTSITTRTRKPRTPAPAVQTPEQAAARAARETREAAYEAACDALIVKALNIAERLKPGRVFTVPYSLGFAVMFGDPEHATHSAGFRGPGNLELTIDLRLRTRQAGSECFVAPTLRCSPRSYSLGSDATLETCEALGRSMIEAAAFGRSLLALTSTWPHAPPEYSEALTSTKT